MRRFESPFLLLITLKLLLVLVHNADLKVALGREIDVPLSVVKLLAPLDEVAFHQVDELVILLRVDPRVLDDQQSVSPERLRNFLAILLPALASLQEPSHIDRWHFEI